MKKRIVLIVKWGIALAFLLEAMEFLKLLALRLNYPFKPIFDIAFILVTIGILYMAIKEMRNKIYQGKISFSRAFSTGVFVMIITAFVAAPCFSIHYIYIDNNSLERFNENAREQYRKKIEADTITRAEVTAFFEYMMLQKDQTLDSLFANAADSTKTAIDSILTLNLQITRKKIEMRTQDSIRIGNFVNYAQKEWMATTAALLYQLEQQKNSSLHFNMLSLATQSLKTSMTQINCVENRMEQQKENIRRYSNPLVVALGQAFVLLLYGLFFNIFVALYLYRKENIENPVEKNDSIRNEDNN